MTCRYEPDGHGNKIQFYILYPDPFLSHSLLVRRTLKNDLTPEEAQALCLEATVMQV